MCKRALVWLSTMPLAHRLGRSSGRDCPSSQTCRSRCRLPGHKLRHSDMHMCFHSCSRKFPEGSLFTATITSRRKIFGVLDKGRTFTSQKSSSKVSFVKANQSFHAQSLRCTSKHLAQWQVRTVWRMPLCICMPLGNNADSTEPAGDSSRVWILA